MTLTAVFIVLVAALAAAFWPRVGLVALWRHYNVRRSRERAENALKHLLVQAAAGQPGTLSSLQGALRTSDRTLLALLERLEREGLVRTESDRFRLTSEGERLAVHIVRAHRLWELYLTDELGVPVGQVHARAERAEHELSPADLNRLSAAMGHPEVDPHGDPIPSRDGEVRPPAGTPLSGWPLSAPARIVHLEDEPPLVFAQLAALGLRLGQVVHVVEHSPARMVLSDGETEYVLAPLLAVNVYVEPAEEPAAPGTSVLRLSDLSSGELGEVIALDPACRGFMRRRLLDLGFTPGARVRPDLTTFAGDPARLSRAGHHHRAAPRTVRAGARPSGRVRVVPIMSNHASCESCPVPAEMARLGEAVGGIRSHRRARRQSQYRQVHAVQRADRPSPAHGQLARQDRDARRRRLQLAGVRYKLVDLPGTYSLLSASQDEEVARELPPLRTARLPSSS